MSCDLFYFKHANNYGDVMSPWLLNKLGISFRIARKHTNNVLFIGSIANQARPNVRVIGSGFIRRNDRVIKSAKYAWMRGPLSRDMVLKAGGKVPELYGDPALLLPKFISESVKVQDIGYVPHHVDYYLIKNGFKVNLVKGSIEHITREITKCRRIVSSSLHGIIVAHAYGIPAAWVKLSNKLVGDDMKFHDHYKSVGLEAICSDVGNPIFQVPSSINTEHMIPLIKEYTR